MPKLGQSMGKKPKFFLKNDSLLGVMGERA